MKVFSFCSSGFCINFVLAYSNYTNFTSKTMSPNARALFQKDTWWDNNIRQISTDMKESAKPVHDNAPIISFVAVCLSP